ncbi:hypothetical protein [uncultured Dokdonia sp.]|uniref:hypothetical protein n=1 Tax=uncultured Dokdonia sp. TaxID=575653 RepID=UPI00263730F7|nr:hypothetical protein [uncultured Dokdonia sp.]
MNRITIQKVNLTLFFLKTMFLLGILMFLNSCTTDPTDELNKKISIALRNDNTIDESEWNSLVKYTMKNKQDLAVLIGENNTINNDELHNLIISISKKKRHKNEVVIFNPEINAIDDIENKGAKINFYFENSGSMNGYLTGDNFNKNMHRIIDKNDPDFTPYFVNTREYKTSNLLDKIDNKNIRTQGTSSSDHEFIFTNAIKNAIGDNLSIVVTDGIYSTSDGNVNIVEVDIEKAFVSALRGNAIETVVLKLSSNYKGTYYTESNCDNVSIDQQRPYYILLFGSKEIIDSALKNTVIIEELSGFMEQARFFLTDNLKYDYTILTQGEEKKGSFKKVGRGGNGLVKEIEDAERFNRGGENYLQFAIAINYLGVPTSPSYVLDKENYRIEGDTQYIIEEIKTIDSLSKNSATYRAIEKINENENVILSHLITIKADYNVTGELEIILENNLPSWIKNTGIENDCDIENDRGKTFAFDNLMTGISKAYKKVSKSDEYLKLVLKVKH